MGIVSSNYTIDAHIQADGTKYVTEIHTDVSGKVYVHGPYKVTSESQVADLIASRIQRLDAILGEAEFNKVLSTNTNIKLYQLSLSQFAVKFWTKLSQVYDSDDKTYFCYMIWWLYNRVVSGNFTSNDIRISYNSFFNKNLTSTQWNNLVNTRLLPAKDRYQAMLDEAQI